MGRINGHIAKLAAAAIADGDSGYQKVQNKIESSAPAPSVYALIESWLKFRLHFCWNVWQCNFKSSFDTEFLWKRRSRVACHVAYLPGA